MTTFCVNGLSCHAQVTNGRRERWLTEDIPIRDPFIYPDLATHTYYLYTQVNKGVAAYTSQDLKEWAGPLVVFNEPANFWATKFVWAPEMHAYQSKFYLFVTFTSQDTVQYQKGITLNRRGTQVLVADSPIGPFKTFANHAHTPSDWMALDGTLFVEEGVPWMVFCHEWLQVKDGTVEAVQLKPDLSATEGASHTLFRASEAPWADSIAYKEGMAFYGYVTDGPYLHRTKGEKLLMIWSSFGASGSYAIGIAESASGRIAGPWKQHPQPLFKSDGGHGMIFRKFDGQLTLVLHQPNASSMERMKFFNLEETHDHLRIK